MSDVFEGLIGPLLDREGGYTNNPADRGGETNFGITAATARAHGYTGKMAAMTRAQAVTIYREIYWTRPGFDQVANLSVRVAAELFDTGVNMGPQVAVRFLQRALNAMNRKGSDYPDVAKDGVMGPATLKALRAYLTRRGSEGEGVLFRALNCLQGASYIELAETRPDNEAFAYGWLANRVGLEAA